MENISVKYETGAAELVRELFGSMPSDEDIAGLAGALDGARRNAGIEGGVRPMPVKHLGLLILSPEEFVAELEAGGFNPDSTYGDYLRMVDSQVMLAVQGRADAIRKGYDVRGVEFDLPPEMQAILNQARAERDTLEAAEEARRLPARAA